VIGIINMKLMFNMQMNVNVMVKAKVKKLVKTIEMTNMKVIKVVIEGEGEVQD